MNKIVREHYPVSKLPKDLQEEFAGFDTVKIVTEEANGLVGLAAVEAMERRYQKHIQRIVSRAPLDIGSHRGKVTIEEAVARIRALRDEWDDE